MTRWEMLELLTDVGRDHSADFRDYFDGWFGWRVSVENGDTVLTVWFTREDGEDFEVTEYEWVLNERETQ